MKVMFYCQHVLGIGHLVRSREIVRSLASADEVTLVNGGEPVDGFGFPTGVKVVQLPPLRTDADFRALETCGAGQTVEEVREQRREQLLAILEGLQPDALVIELFPFGRKHFAPELLPLLERARSGGRTLVACSLRDILVEKPDRAKHENRVCQIVNSSFDLVLVHGDPSFQRLDETFHSVAGLRCPVRYTGYVAQEEPACGEDALPGGAGELIVASIGSGRYREGQSLLESVIRAARLLQPTLPHRFRIFAGPSVPEDVYERLVRLAAETANVDVEKYSPHLISYLRRADLSINMGGYNTIMDILSAGVRSLVYPYTANNDQEQYIRALKLEHLGVLDLLHPATLAPEDLASKITGALSRPKARIAFAMDGAANTTWILRAAVASRQQRRSAHGITHEAA